MAGEKPRHLKETLLRLWGMTSGNRRALATVIIFSCVAAGGTTFSPLLIGRAVSAVDASRPVVGILALLTGLYLGVAGVTFFQHYLMASASSRVINHIRTVLFSRMKNLPLAFFAHRTHGELMSRLTNDVDNVSVTISSSLTMLCTQVLSLGGIFCMMVFMSPLLTCIATTGAGAVFVLVKIVTARTHELFARQQKILGRLNGHVEESVSAPDVVKSFCLEERMIAQFERENDELCDVATRAQIWSGYLMPLANVINNVSYLSLAAASGVLALRGILPLGTVTAFLLFIRNFTRPFVNIAGIYNEFQTAVAGLERIFDLMDETPEPPDSPDARSLENPRGEIEFRNVTFGYDPDAPVLKDVSLRVPSGTHLALVGPTGAGKTTLVSLLTRFYDVDDGEILLDGCDLREYRRADLRRAFCAVPQDTFLFAGTVGANIAAFREGATPDEIRSAARSAGAEKFIDRLPDGFDTVLTSGGPELSGGERQLVALARAAMNAAPISILDEATSSVDSLTEAQIHRAMGELISGRTFFIIAHRLSTVRDADCIALIDGGKIVELGTHDQLMAQDGLYAAAYRTQTLS